MRTRYGEITKDILITIALAGMLVIASTSPYFWINLAKGILRYKKYGRGKGGKIAEGNLIRSLVGLNKNKIIILERKGDKFIIKLTEKGKRIIKEIQLNDMRIEKPKVWDRKWRIIIFDIPEKKGRRARDAMREKLQKIGFYQFQKSVWAYPYPCEKEIRLLCEVFGINPFVNIITTQEIYNDDDLKKYFNL